MHCRHFGSCGSCGLYDMDYESQIIEKSERVSGLLSPFYTGELSIYDSPQEHYRARSEFRIWHSGDRCDYAMGNLTKDGKIDISQCPKVIRAIESRMWRLLDEINSSKVLKTKLFGVEFLATTTGEALITMLYHRKLDDEWSVEAKRLETLLECSILGRSRKQKVILSSEYVTEVLQVDGRDVTYIEYESGFTQPNPAVNVKMIEWAISKAQSAGYGDLLESYCGLGNFTIPLSRYFERILATEVSKRSIQAAKENCTRNGVENISSVRLSSEEMTQALRGVREFTRLKDIDLDEYSFSTVLVDPPRAGLDADTIGLISDIEHIIYISCNPETLARDLESLSLTHRVEDAAMFDQFPHTSHVESGVFLRKI